MTSIDELIESLEGEAQGLLAAELNHTSTPAGPAANVMIEAAAALSTLQEQKRKLEEALKPFAMAADDLDDDHRDDSSIWEAPAAMNITADDLRNARSLVPGGGA